MKIQSELTRKLASRFSAPKNITEPREVLEVQALVEEWMDKFPPVYSVHTPDLSLDHRYPWIFPHRYYVFTMACLLILNPMRHYMVKSYTSESPAEELSIRAIGVSYSLKLMKTLRSWVDGIYTRDGRLHFIVFSIFDTAAILCTAMIKDTEHTLMERDEIMTVINDGVSMLRYLNTISKTSRTSYGLLEWLVRRLPAETPQQTRSRKKAKVSAPVAEAAAATSVSHLSLVPNAQVTSSAVSYGNQIDLQLAPRPFLRSNLVPSLYDVPRVSVPGNCIPVDDGELYSDYSTCSDATPSSMDDHIFSSFSTFRGGGVVSVDPLPQAVVEDTGVFPPPADHASPKFDLETITRTQLGELAPLWDWHSKNLDLARVGANGMVGPGYIPVTVVRRRM